jgi:hypothetical protein
VSAASRALRGALRSPAWLAFLVYGGISLGVGECFPFSQYRMYAVPDYDRGTALVFLEDGEVVPDIQRYAAFADIDPEALRYPPGQRGSQEYLLDAVRHRVRVRSPQAPPEGAPVQLRIGYAVARSTEDGIELLEPFVLLAEGRAWRAD